MFKSNPLDILSDLKEGEVVKRGDVIADGPATQNGEMALGKNLLIAFATWEGYNYEDAILLNERLVKEDVLTSMHIEDYECDSNDLVLTSENGIVNDLAKGYMLGDQCKIGMGMFIMERTALIDIINIRSTRN